MFRRLSFILFLMTFIVGTAYGGLSDAGSPVRYVPDVIFGDPDDEFNPHEHNLLNDHSTGESTSRGVREDGGGGPDPSNHFLFDYLILILQTQFEK